MLTVFVNSIFRACTVPVQPDRAEPVVAESGDSAEDTVSTKLHRNAGDKGGTESRAASWLWFHSGRFKTREVTSMRQKWLSSAHTNWSTHIWLTCFLFCFCFGWTVFLNILLVFCFWECLLLPFHCTQRLLAFVYLRPACPNNHILHFVPQRPIVLKYLRKKSAWTEDGEQKVSAKMQNSSFRYYFLPLSCQINAHQAKRCRLLLLTDLV